MAGASRRGLRSRGGLRRSAARRPSPDAVRVTLQSRRGPRAGRLWLARPDQHPGGGGRHQLAVAAAVADREARGESGTARAGRLPSSPLLRVRTVPAIRSLAMSDTALQSARERLDQHVREIVHWHFNPATGCPFWLERAKQFTF